MTRRAAVGCAAALVLLGSFPFARPYWRQRALRSAPRPLDVLLITLDTTRADHLGCYGYPGGTSPNLDALARTGVLFRRAYSHVPLTSPSHSSIMTGLIPPSHGVHDNGLYALGPGPSTLAERFVEAGYRTAAFVSAFVLDRRFGLARGFATYEDDVVGGGGEDIVASIRGDRTVDRAIRWLKAEDPRPIFVWVHLYDPHSPYEPPEPYATRFKQAPYDGEIAFMDAQVGRLLVAARGRGRPLLVAAIADHGESLGEHSELGHSYFIYETTQHVPFLVSLPGHMAEGLEVGPVVRGVDVMPTLLDVAGLEIPPSLDGRSLVPLITTRSRVEPGPAYLESFEPRLWWGVKELRGLRTGPWLFIESPRPELYDVDVDPKQERNLAAQRPQELAAFSKRLAAMVGPSDPMAGNTASDPEVAARLRALGYLGTSAPAAPGEALRDAKDNAPLLIGASKGNELYNQQRWAEALQVFQDTLLLNPRSASIRGRMAEVLLKLGRYQESFDVCAQLYAEMPAEDYPIGMSLALSHQGRKQEALKLLQSEAPRFPASVRFHQELGLLLADLGRLDEAETEFREASSRAPKFLEARLRLGQVLARRARMGEAGRRLREVVELSPRSREAREAATALAACAESLIAAGSLTEAKDALRAALDAGHATEAVYLNLGLVCYRLGRRDEARDMLSQGIAVLPASAALHYRLGRLREELGGPADARLEYQRALELEPGNRDATRALASLMQRAGGTR